LLKSTDVFVVGGGPAGLAAGIAARQNGLRVVVADGAEAPIDKTCGEGLMPDGLLALQGLGITLKPGDGYPFRGIRFLSSSLSADAPFPSGGVGLAVRRTTLHRIMADRAADAGVELLWQTAVTGISEEEVRLGNRTVSTKWIVGADGVNSRVRRWAGLDARAGTDLRYAFRRHYRVAPWSDHMEVYWGDRSQGYATAVSGEEVCVAVASHDAKLRVEEALLALPELGARLRGTEAVSAERGALTANRTLKRVYRRNVALIGDASGTVDAITGQGLGLSFSQAVALAHCFTSGNLESYQAEHRHLALRPLWMARLMLTLDGRPKLQRRTLQVFRQRPEIFARLLALHVGALSPKNMALDGISLGWGLLTA
jgi:flavin-dependent dehydrogenase